MTGQSQPPPPPAPPLAKPGAQDRDPGVYGGQWGDSGKSKDPGPQPTDRPDRIETPPEKN